ncbi:uncharacterized protein BDV14DRAFT_175953 [Aspergillus stella-maris]|uniref:uncharacterized protein n=1 Tax=Aspergillus stella-maris TaxID=1810926 RepID=UPI003CCE3DBB
MARRTRSRRARRSTLSRPGTLVKRVSVAPGSVWSVDAAWWRVGLVRVVVVMVVSRAWWSRMSPWTRRTVVMTVT